MRIIEIKSINTDTRKFGAFTKQQPSIIEDAFVESLVVRVTMEVNILEYFTLISAVGSKNIFLCPYNGDLIHTDTTILDEDLDRRLSELLGSEGRKIFDNQFNNAWNKSNLPLGFTRFRVVAEFRGWDIVSLYGTEEEAASVRFSEGWRDVISKSIKKIYKNTGTIRYSIGNTVTTSMFKNDWGSNSANLVAVANDIRYVEIKKSSDISDSKKIQQFHYHIDETLCHQADVYIGCKLSFQDLLVIICNENIEVLAVDDFNNLEYLQGIAEFFMEKRVLPSMYLSLLRTCLTTPFTDGLIPSIIPLSAPITFLIRIKVPFSTNTHMKKHNSTEIQYICESFKVTPGGKSISNILTGLDNNGWF